MTDSTTDKVELPTWADAFEGWLNKEDSDDREQLERAWATAIRWATYTRAQHVQSVEHADMPRRWCSVHGKEEFKYESYEHELKARDNYELGRHDERRLTMQLIGAVRMDTQTGGSGDVLDKLVMSIASHELPRYNAHVQSPSEQVRAAEAEIKAFAQELAEADLAYGFYDGEYVEKRVTEIITKHVHPASLAEPKKLVDEIDDLLSEAIGYDYTNRGPAMIALERLVERNSAPVGPSLTDAIEVVNRVTSAYFNAAEDKLLEKEPKYGKSYWSGRQDAAEGIMREILESLQGKAPVGESGPGSNRSS